MKNIRISIVLLTLLVGACATGPSEDEIAAQQAVEQQAQRAAAEAQFEAQRVEQERLLAEDRARAAAAERARQEQARAETERQEQAETERRRQQEQAAPSVEQRAQAVARQQERIAELRTQIATSQTETTNLEAANATLLQAITAAEELVATLTGEQEKYTATDPDTGTTTQPLSKERIDELSAQLERLQTQAAALTQQP
jgi:hypothetical protein